MPLQAAMFSAEQTDYVGTDANEDFQGVAGGRDATLLPDTTIDGGAGQDKVTVDMQGNFKGFENETPLTNIETVELVNSGKSARVFNAENIDGVDTWQLTSQPGQLTVNNLGYIPEAVNIKGLTGTDKIAFANKVTDGDNSIILGLDNVGAVATKTGAPNTYAKVAMEGIETVTVNNLNTSGVNYVDLSSLAGSKSLAVEGTGNIEINNVADTVTAFTAENASGNVKADLTNAKALSALTLGNGDDTITLVNNFDTNSAVIDGGEGKDTLIFKSATNLPTVPTMTDVETIDLNLSGEVNMNLENVTGLDEFILRNGAKLSTRNMDNFDALTLTDYGTTTGAILNGGEYDLTYNVGKGATVTANIEATTTGAVTIQSADSTATLQTGSKFDIDNATELTFTANAVNNAEIILVADSVETLSIDTGSQQGNVLKLNGGLSAALSNAVDMNTNPTDVQFLGSVTEINVTGNGVLQIGDKGYIGSNATMDDEITINATTSGGFQMLSTSVAAGTVVFNGSEHDDIFQATVYGDSNEINLGLGSDSVFLYVGRADSWNPGTAASKAYSTTNISFGDDFTSDSLHVIQGGDQVGALVIVDDFVTTSANGTGVDNITTTGGLAVNTTLDTTAKAQDVLTLFGITDEVTKVDTADKKFFVAGENAYVLLSATATDSITASTTDLGANAFTLVELVGVGDTFDASTNIA